MNVLFHAFYLVREGVGLWVRQGELEMWEFRSEVGVKILE